MALTRQGAALTDAHRIEQVMHGARFLALSMMLADLLNPDNLDSQAFTDWVALQVLLAERLHNESADLAVGYTEAFRASEAGELTSSSMPIVRPVFDAARVMLRSQLVLPIVKKRIALGLFPKVALSRTLDEITISSHVDVMAGGRGVVDLSTLANQESTGWRRVSDGHPCAFCAMLVSRGPAYKSEKTAGNGRRYHERCGCAVEEVFGLWTPNDREERYISVYDTVHRPGDTARDIARKMREHDEDGVLNDSTAGRVATGPDGPRGPTKPPGGGSTGLGVDGDDDEPWHGHAKGYVHPHGNQIWPESERVDRQRALASELSGEQLYQHEIESVERLEKLGHRLRWIPRDNSQATNDAKWLSMGAIEVDLKSTKAKQSTIIGRIVDCFIQAENAIARGKTPVGKHNFIIDIGDKSLTKKLNTQLSSFNARRKGAVPARQISRLWVLSRGELVEIELL